MSYDYGRKYISKMTGLTGIESGNIARELVKRAIDYTEIDWETLGGDTRDFGKRSESVKKKLGSMYGVSLGIPESSIGHERARYSAMEEISVMPGLMEIHERRSPRSKRLDLNLKAKGTFKPTNRKGVKKWKKHPNRYDIIGIDDIIKL